MPKISTYSLDSTITDNDSLLGVNAADGTTKRYSMSGIKAALLAGADITAVIAGTGLSGGATSGAATLTIDSTVVTKTGTQTLTNKTLTTPVISSISNSGTLTLPTSSDTLVGRATTDTLTNKTLTSPVINTGVSGSAILDEDNFASNSATKLATQQSIKAYVDGFDAATTETGIANGDYILFLDGGASGTTKKEGVDDLAVLFAGAGLTAANAVLAVGAGTGITVNANDIAVAGAQTSITSLLAADIKIGEDDQTKIDFETANEIHFYANNVEQVYLGDNIFGPQTDSDVDLGSTGVRWKAAFVDTLTTTGNVVIGGTLSVSGNNFSNVEDIGLNSISAASNDINISLTDNRATALTIKQGSDPYMIFDTANSSESVSIGTGISGTAITIGHTTSETTIADNLTVAGNLTISGTTTTVNSTTTTLDDPIITLGGDTAPNSDDNKDRGVEYRYHTGSAAKVGFFGMDDSTGKFTFIPDATNSSEVFSGTPGTIAATTFEGNLTGNATGLSSTLAVASGGTNATSFAAKSAIITQDSGDATLSAVSMAANGKLLIGGTSGPAVASLIGGTNVTVVPGDGTITLNVAAAGEAFKTISVSGQSDVVADGTADTLTFAAGTGTTITTNAGTDTITISAGTNTIEVDEFTGNGSTTAYTLSTAAVTENNLLVYMDGVYQHHNTYAVSGTTLTFDTNVPNGSKVEAFHMRTISNTSLVQSAVAGTLMDVSGATGDVTFNVDLSEAAEEAIANGDYMLFLDGGATGVAKKEAVADIATLFAGTGLTASNSVINIDAAQTGITSVLNTSLVLGRDADNQIKFGTDNQIIFEVSGGDNVIFKASGEIEATTVNTTGAATIGGNGSSGGVTLNDGSIQLRSGTGSVAEMRFYCEVSNAHYQTVKAAPHSASSSAALVLPTASGNLIGTGDTGTVASGMIAADAITGAKIADNALDSEHYTDGSIDTAHLAADSVTGAKIPDNAINSEHYTDGSIDTAHIADLNVTTGKIAADAITGAKIADDAIDSEHYTDASIDNAHIADDAIDSEHYAAGSIDTAHIADNQITHDKLEGRYTALKAWGTGGSRDLDFGSFTTFTATMNGNATFTIVAPKQGQVVDLILAGDHTPTLAMTGATFNKVGSVDYDGGETNLIQILVADDASSEIFYYSVAPIASDTTP